MREEGQSMSADRQASIQMLNDCHHFPCPFTFRVIGENSPDFVARVVQAAVLVLGTDVFPQVTTRESARGNHQAVTMVVEVTRAEGVLDVYAALRSLAGVKLLL